MGYATGASRAATGSISANADSTLTLVEPSDQVMITNDSAVTAYVRLNGAVSASVYDFVLSAGDAEWVEGVKIETVHVYMNATAGLRVVAW